MMGSCGGGRRGNFGMSSTGLASRGMCELGGLGEEGFCLNFLVVGGGNRVV
jgi:hypothetical protein